ncbi:MAG: HEAT repeat domain-containing protein [Anaerolineae bacterium]|nr:HEAT repeat domain-containing protein [Anaerolineae bacterium]
MSLFGLFGPPDVEKLMAEADVKGLIKALSYQKDPSVRKRAAEALGKLIHGQPGMAVPLFVKALQYEGVYRDAFLSDFALHGGSTLAEPAIRKLKERISSALCEALLRDEAEDVRKTAAWALGELGPAAKEAVPALIQAMRNEEWQVRKAIAAALGVITEQNFGEDIARWQQWWEKQRQ